MAEYHIVTLFDGKEADREGPYYVKERTEKKAQNLSRQFTSSTFTVAIVATDGMTNDMLKGYPKLYRMGRLYKS